MWEKEASRLARWEASSCEGKERTSCKQSTSGWYSDTQERIPLPNAARSPFTFQVVIFMRWIIIPSMVEEPLEARIGELLRRRGLRLAVAESCTGGLLGHRITNIPGSSTYYVGSVTAYAYEAKVRLLGVRWATLEKYGAVSQETALEMARGVRLALAADVGLSITGIAGPGGGTLDKPVGTVWIGLSATSARQESSNSEVKEIASDFEKAWSYLWKGDRLQIKEQSAEQALSLLIAYLSSKTI
jgi:nicotinamide-nucleotide amidase